MAADRLQAPGYVVRESAKEGSYLCPGCNQRIAPGAHLVVFSEDDPEGRRHWHTSCWERERKRLR